MIGNTPSLIQSPRQKDKPQNQKNNNENSGKCHNHRLLLQPAKGY